ncbi:ComEC family competence protein, partial [Candidatus Aerophobetes bacterium]|nr:ComEC family competence protein [Candidatus Aerophobetes bacterium]
HFISFYYPSSRDICHFASSGENFEVEGKIISSPHFFEGIRKRITFVLQTERIKQDKEISSLSQNEWIDVKGRIWVNSFYPYKNLDYGDRVLIRGKLFLPEESAGEENFSWRNYLAYQGIFSQINTGKVDVLQRNQGNFLVHLAFSTADWMKDVISQGLPHPFSATLKGMMLGDRETLPPNILNSFRVTGTAHVLVVSGLHVGLLLLIIFSLVRLIGFSQRIAFLVSMPVIFYYAILTGLRPPIVRASLMAIIGIICYFLDRQVPLIIILFLAAFFILIINPLSLFTVSFQLSFLAVGGIVYLTPYLEKKMRVMPDFLKKPLSVSCAAQIFLLPLLAFYFGQFPLIGFVANVIIVPLLTVVLFLGFFSVALATLTLQGAWIFFNSTYLILRGFLFIIDLLSFSFAPGLALFFSPRVSSPPLWMLFVYYALLIALPLSQNMQKKVEEEKE